MSKEDKKAKKAAKKAAKAEKKANKTPMDVDVKVTLIRCICAIVCVAIVVLSLSNGIGKISDTKLEIAKSVSGESSDDIGGDDGDYTDDGTVTDDGTAAADGEIKDDPAATDDTSASGDTAADNSSSGGATAPSNNSGSSNTASNTGTASKAPSTAAEIVKYYNTATAKAVSAKVGYNKTRTTDNEKMDASGALMAMKSLVFKFMGIGAENKYQETVTKGNWGENPYLLASKLTTSDVTSATCTKSGSNYVITLKLKSGSSAADKSNPVTAPNSSLDKCGICVGTEDKSRFDHKTASVIYDAIEGTYASAVVKEQYSNAVLKATINATTGNIVSILVEWNVSVEISKILGMSAKASGISHVSYSAFKY